MVRRKSKRDEDKAEQKLRKIHDRERKYLYDEVTTSPDKVDDLVNEQMNGAEEKGEDGEEDEEDEEDEDEEDEEDEDEDDDDDEDVDVRGDEDEDEDEDDEEMRELETLENQENANNFFEMAEQETTAQDQQPRAKDDDFLNPGNENEHIQQVRRGLRDRTKSLTTIKGWCDDLMGRRRQRIVNEDIENGTTEGDEQSTDDIEAEAGTDSSEERFESNENIVGNDSQASSSSTSNRTVQTTRNTKDGRNKKTKKKEIREMVNRINNDHDYKQTFETVRDSKTVVWKDGAKNDFTDQFNPAEEPGIHADVYDKDPLELFELMWNNEVMDAWLYNSNIKGYILYGNSKSGWKEISIGEGYIFLAITLSLGLSPKRRLKDYWQKNNLYGSIFCRSHMSRFRFLQILGASTFVENELELGDGGKGNIASSSFSRTWKIDNMTNLLIKQFQTYYRAGRRICIDESMIKFTGRFTWKQHIPRKPIKDGIKIWALNCGESKYLLNFIIYAAQTWSRSTGPGSLIFGTMWALITGENCPFAKSLINEGRILAGDSLFSMVGAVLALLKARVYYVGTIGKNRGLDEEQISGRIVGINGVRRKMKRGEAKFFTDDEKKIQMVVWKDTGLVKMVSTVPELSTDMVTTSRKLEKLVDNRKVTTSEVISMPEILKEFNISKGGTDIFNQYVATNHTQMKTRFWPRPVFIWGIEASAVNCYILANLAEKDKWNSRSFRQCLINGLIKKGLAQLGRNDPQRPLGNQPIRHVNIWMGPNYKSNLIPRMRSPPRWFDMKNLRLNKKITHVCGRGNSLNLCIVHKQIKKTSIICMQCMVPLCLENCWYNWHNVMDYIFDDPLRQNVRTMRTTSTH